MPSYTQAAEYPALRPVVLVLKCILGQAELNDASKGGLSSFALANMAVASLQEDAKVRLVQTAVSDTTPILC